MSRPSIYVQLGNVTRIAPVSGDRIETVRFMRTLHKFADVYYNDELFNPDSPDFGLTKTEVTLPKREYDLYYVRANHDLFKQLPSPKVTMAYPYDAESYEMADALLVTTSEWKRLLETFDASPDSRKMLAKWYPVDRLPPHKQIINIRQTIDPAFEMATSKRVHHYRALMTNGFVYGYFGRVTTETLPYLFLEAYRRLRKKYPEPVVAMGGNIRCNLAPDIIDLGKIDYSDMPNVVHACNAILANEERDAEFLGSGKVLEGIGAGIPIITKRTAARQEHLGPEYPLYYESEEDAFRLAEELMTNGDLAARTREALKARRNIFSLDAQSVWLQKQLTPLMI